MSGKSIPWKSVSVCTLTAEQYRAELDKRRSYCLAIKDAFMRGDLAGCEAAQKAMREAFQSAVIS